MKLPIGISDFKELIENGYHFVDKSLFINEVMDDGSKVILLTRPRRFGKTINLSMLYYFLHQNPHKESGNLFQNLAILKEKKLCHDFQHQYPVIFISFKDIKKLSYPEAYLDVVTLMSELYGNHRYLLEDELLYEDEKRTFLAMLDKTADASDVENALKRLTEYLARHSTKKTILLIDEYDTPIHSGYVNGYYTEIVSLLRSIFGRALKDNIYLEKAVITGITRVSQESLFSGLNNIEVYSLLREKFGQYFGFTEDEVVSLLSQSNLSGVLAAIKSWYNGYQIGKYTLYNPWSIINCLKQDGALKPYWINTSDNVLIKHLMDEAKPTVKQQFEQLLQGKIVEQSISENLVFSDLEKDEEAVWSLLLYAGYLNVLSSEQRGYQLVAKISIPNKEVSFVYDKIVAQWFTQTISLESYDRFAQSLVHGNIEEFKMSLSSYIMQTGSCFDFNCNTPEQVFHSFILGLVVGLRDNYIIQSNQESGFGRYDVAFIPKNKQQQGILLEFKTTDKPETLANKAQEALAQIKGKQYTTIFTQHSISSVLALGIAFSGKRLEIASEMFDLR